MLRCSLEAEIKDGTTLLETQQHSWDEKSQPPQQKVYGSHTKPGFPTVGRWDWWKNDTGDWWKLMKILGKTAINSTEKYNMRGLTSVICGYDFVSKRDWNSAKWLNGEHDAKG